eukprot:scaffold2823_cov118-Isochrysis_galbana.AAC.4
MVASKPSGRSERTMEASASPASISAEPGCSGSGVYDGGMSGEAVGLVAFGGTGPSEVGAARPMPKDGADRPRPLTTSVSRSDVPRGERRFRREASAAVPPVAPPSARRTPATAPTVRGRSHSRQPEPVLAARLPIAAINSSAAEPLVDSACTSRNRRSAGSASSVAAALTAAARLPRMSEGAGASRAYCAPALSQSRAWCALFSGNGPTVQLASRSIAMRAGDGGALSSAEENQRKTWLARPRRRTISASGSAAASPLIAAARGSRRSRTAKRPMRLLDLGAGADEVRCVYFKWLSQPA